MTYRDVSKRLLVVTITVIFQFVLTQFLYFFLAIVIGTLQNLLITADSLTKVMYGAMESRYGKCFHLGSNHTEKCLAHR